MSVFFAIITVVLTVLYVCLLGIRLSPSTISRFELRRRSLLRDNQAKKALAREERLADYVTLVWLKTNLVFLFLILSCLAAFSWWGILYGFIVAVCAGSAARLDVIRAPSEWLWRQLIPVFDATISKATPLLRTLRVDNTVDSDVYRRFESREELEHLIKISGSVLSTQEKSLIASGLAFGNERVRDVMTPRGAIDTINKEEFLGPLVLDELHATGHSRLPVVDGDIDHIVGILHLHDLLTLHEKKSAVAADAMDSRVFYVHEDDTLDHALAAFIKNRRHLFVVINDSRETVGLLSLEDVIERMIGRQIMDEDDIHEDLHAVAAQRGLVNNNGRHHVDI